MHIATISFGYYQKIPSCILRLGFYIFGNLGCPRWTINIMFNWCLQLKCWINRSELNAYRNNQFGYFNWPIKLPKISFKQVFNSNVKRNGLRHTWSYIGCKEYNLTPKKIRISDSILSDCYATFGFLSSRSTILVLLIELLRCNSWLDVSTFSAHFLCRFGLWLCVGLKTENCEDIFHGGNGGCEVSGISDSVSSRRNDKSELRRNTKRKNDYLYAY